MSLLISLKPIPYWTLQPEPPPTPRPPTAKPKDPDEIEFADESVAKDYRKMFDKVKEMEAMLEAARAANNAEQPTEANAEAENDQNTDEED